jgi:uncharacterized protein YeaO (DUF488 family)
MKDAIKKEVDRVIAASIPTIPRMIDVYIREIITKEICQQLNLRYSFGRFEPGNDSSGGAFRMELRNKVAEQFKDVMQKNLADVLTKRDMTAIKKAASKAVHEATMFEFRKLWAEELSEIAHQEAEKLVEEVKSGMMEENQ